MKRLTSLFLATLAQLLFTGAFALEATLNFPQGITPGQKTPVEVSLSADAANYKGTPLGLVLDGGQNSVATEINLGNIGDALHGEIMPEVAGTNRLAIKMNYGGKRYAQVIEMNLPQQPGQIKMEIAAITQRRVPLPQYLLWVFGAAALGALALRGKDYLF